jgi:hypothetical protein
MKNVMRKENDQVDAREDIEDGFGKIEIKHASRTAQDDMEVVR